MVISDTATEKEYTWEASPSQQQFCARKPVLTLAPWGTELCSAGLASAPLCSPPRGPFCQAPWSSCSYFLISSVPQKNQVTLLRNAKLQYLSLSDHTALADWQSNSLSWCESHTRAIIFRSLKQNAIRCSSAFSVVFPRSMHRYQGTHSGGLSPPFLFLYNLLGEISVKPPSCPLLSQQHILSLIEQVFIITEAFIFYSRGEFHEFGNSRLNWQLQVELATPGWISNSRLGCWYIKGGDKDIKLPRSFVHSSTK